MSSHMMDPTLLPQLSHYGVNPWKTRLTLLFIQFWLTFCDIPFPDIWFFQLTFRI